MYCEFFLKENLISKINADFLSGEVTFENFTDDINILPFGIRKKATLEDFYNFLNDRAMPESRFNCKEVLDDIKHQCYDLIEIVKYNKGTSVEDQGWIKFEGDDTTYEDIKQIFASR